MKWMVDLSLVGFITLFGGAFGSLVGSMYLLMMGAGYYVEWELFSLNSSFMEMVLILDWMSMMFSSFVLFISSAVMLYSGGYMYMEVNKPRFMYLVLGFVASMEFLIFSPNLVSILLGWDGLGLVSYVLVIFYQSDKSANAGMLTALTNRLGDVGIMLGIGAMSGLGSWNYVLQEPSSVKGLSVIVVLAAMTKSAQIPFSAWLPAAMAAPTPVSALVHSSTLVTAGVYLLIRFSPWLGDGYSGPLLILASSLTAFMAGLGANFETDLKKIIALSTLSQLGLMMFTLSLGLSELAFFHLLTHAMFKALLFMGAGSVIHATGDNQDIRSMGGLVDSMPLSITSINLANMALCGVPFLAGFYSKDLIMETVFSSVLNSVCFGLTATSVGLTVSYTTRLMFFTMGSFWSMSSLSGVSDSEVKLSCPGLMLGVGAVIGGASLSWAMLPSPYMVCLPTGFKTLVLVVSALGAWMGYILNKVGSSDRNKSLGRSSEVSFFSTMWFMPGLSTKIVSSKVLSLSMGCQEVGDEGWLEYYGSGMVEAWTKLMMVRLQVGQDKGVKMYMMMALVWFSGLVFTM